MISCGVTSVTSLFPHQNRDVEKAEDNYVTHLKRRLRDYTSELR